MNRTRHVRRHKAADRGPGARRSSGLIVDPPRRPRSCARVARSAHGHVDVETDLRRAAAPAIRGQTAYLWSTEARTNTAANMRSRSEPPSVPRADGRLISRSSMTVRVAQDIAAGTGLRGLETGSRARWQSAKSAAGRVTARPYSLELHCESSLAEDGGLSDSITACSRRPASRWSRRGGWPTATLCGGHRGRSARPFAIVDVRMPPTFTDEAPASAERISASGDRPGVCADSDGRRPGPCHAAWETGRAIGVGISSRTRRDIDELADAVRRRGTGRDVIDPTVVASITAGPTRDPASIR